MAATIKDVAKYANLSAATVSKYINGVTLKERNRLAVQEAIEKLGFKANTIARSLKTNKSMSVGVLTPYLESPFNTALITYMEKTLIKHGYSTIICDYNFEAENQKEKSEFLLNRMVDGMIIFPMHGAVNDDNIRKVAEHVPVVVIDKTMEGFDCDAVLVDNINSSYGAVEQLMMRGHKRIGLICGPEDHFSAKERLKGYIRVHEDYGIEVDRNLIRHGEYTLEFGQKALLDLMGMSNPPTAVFATNYDMTIGVAIAINEKNIVVPDELSIIGFDDFLLSRVFKPQLSIVLQPLQEMGEKSAELLIRRMKGDMSNHPMVYRLKADILIKDSIKSIL